MHFEHYLRSNDVSITKSKAVFHLVSLNTESQSDRLGKYSSALFGALTKLS